ncbi:MAG: branched-chain amino acid ABC transporter substrate-binding protein [Planctomycetota bacterium]|nr:MAG: branched-chain amino acid ABC transporter substrate-binding protein [Planctomycetota bacterium]
MISHPCFAAVRVCSSLLAVSMSASSLAQNETAAAPVATASSVKIVSSLPRTGSANSQTTSMVNGIKMAIAEVGANIGGVAILYEDWDDASPQRGNWDPAIEAGNAEKAILDPTVMAYIGTYNSGAAKISMPKLNAAGMVMVSPANTAPNLTKSGFGEASEPAVYRPSGIVSYFRVVPTDDVQGAVAADFAKEIGLTKVFVLNDREVYGKGVATVFEARAREIGLEVTGVDGLDAKASNYKSLVTKIKQSGADLVYFGGTTQTNAGQLAKDIVSGGLKAKLMVPDGCYEQAFIEAAGTKALEGNVFVTFGGRDPKTMTGKGKEFYENYVKTYKVEPEGYAAYGYESGKVVLTAMQRIIDAKGTLTRASVLAEVAKTKDFSGALGTWSFDANGDTTNRTMSVFEVKGGVFSTVKVVD